MQPKSENEKNKSPATTKLLFDLPLFSLLAICTIGSTVEFCWASGEAVLVPFLIKHGVKKWVVSTIFLSNPVLGLWVQPKLGLWSDEINRRIPFVVALAFTAFLGTATLLSAIPLMHMLRFQDESFDSHIPPIAIIIVFFGFGVADISYDCLLIPGRALIDDLAVPASREEEANALFTGFQLGGRLVALMLGSSTLTLSGLCGIYQGIDAHFNAMFTLSALFLICSLFLVVMLVNEQGAVPSNESWFFSMNLMNMAIVGSKDEETYLQATSSDSSNYEAISSTTNDEDILTTYNDVDPFHGFVSTSSNLSKVEAITKAVNEDVLTIDNSVDRSRGSDVYISVLLCSVQALGWMGICAQSFFWTTWRGEIAGCADLACQAVVGIITAASIPQANKYFGAATVWCGSELLFHLLMASTILVSNPLQTSFLSFPRIISALSGINYAVHATNSFIVAADVVADPTQTARTIAMINNTLPMGQLVTAIFGGAIAQYFGGFKYVFILFGILGLIVTSVVWCVSSRRRLFEKRIDY